MKITVNVNIENSKRGWAAVANHVKHDPHQKHSNKDIEPELRSLDVWGLGAKYGVREWQEEKFGAFVKAHDEKLKKQGRREKDRYYHSVQGFLGRKNRQTAVITFGNNESWKKLIRAMGCQEGIDYTVEHEDKGNGNVYEWYKLNPQSDKVKDLRKRVVRGFGNWRKEINDDEDVSNYMHIGRCAIHFDEHGAPHMHAEMAFCGRTKKGAPTPSMSTAITQMIAGVCDPAPKNNREAFRAFRHATDNTLLEEMEKQFSHGEEPFFELERTGRDTSRDMETYKATEDQRLADEKAKLEEVKQRRKAEEQRLEELKQQQEQQRQEMQQQRDEQQRQLESLSREKAQKERELSAVQAQLEKARETLANVSKVFMRGVKRLLAYTRQSWLRINSKPFSQSPQSTCYPREEEVDTRPTNVLAQAKDLSDNKVVQQVVERLGGNNDDGYTLGIGTQELEFANRDISPYPKVAGKSADIPGAAQALPAMEERVQAEKEEQYYGPTY